MPGIAGERRPPDETMDLANAEPGRTLRADRMVWGGDFTPASRESVTKGSQSMRALTVLFLAGSRGESIMPLGVSNRKEFDPVPEKVDPCGRSWKVDRKIRI